MSIDRATLPGAGAPKITWNGGEFWTADDVAIPIQHALVEQRSSMYGRVTKTLGGRMIEISVPLFGLWANIARLFPASILNPTIGSRVFTGADLPMVLHAKNGDRLTIHNVHLTKVADLKLAANQRIFSANAVFTGLLKNNADPEDANSYFTYDTAAYSEGSFAMTTFKARTWTGAWGALTGFTSILTEAGWDVSWEITMEPDVVDGLGVVDMFLTHFWGSASCIPVGPTAAQIEAQQKFQGAGAGIGADAATTSDLVLTDGTNSVTLKSATLTSTGLVFAPNKKRIGPTSWECTRGFSAGTPQALATTA